MNKAPDGYITHICDKCGARFTSEKRAKNHGCSTRYLTEQ